MCVDKIAYFNPTVNGDFTYNYSANDEGLINARFDFGLFKVDTQNTADYSLELVVKEDNSDGALIFENTYNLGDTKFTNVIDNRGNADLYVNANGIRAVTSHTYYATLTLKFQGAVRDTANSYYEVA